MCLVGWILERMEKKKERKWGGKTFWRVFDWEEEREKKCDGACVFFSSSSPKCFRPKMGRKLREGVWFVKWTKMPQLLSYATLVFFFFFFSFAFLDTLPLFLFLFFFWFPWVWAMWVFIYLFFVFCFLSKLWLFFLGHFFFLGKILFWSLNFTKSLFFVLKL